ncbi:hypothetical protein IMCC14465_04980 [alpha proteobacterium IMCC14465]|uniref:UDP-glucose 6-dehydrogenase n=1 Tax=alpha proteobacterium IMCC14465 TaxID=1220535 RepID=J9E2M0_9PROT|nr:hypothetical protein IMCC14465_04980 [alpha proteobacterium IMCC14465]
MRYLVVGLGHVGLPLYHHLGLKKGAKNVFAIDKNLEKVEALRKGLIESREPGISLSEPQMKNISQDLNSLGFDGFVEIHICVDVSIKGEVYDTINLMDAIDDCKVNLPESLILIRSTISPEIISQLRGNEIGNFQCLAFKPEFLREGLALKDLVNEPDYVGIIVEGANFEENHLEDYSTYTPESLSVLKVANNAWRATKVSFANMLATLCEKLNADPKEVSDLFLLDTLNISEAYLKPGAPYGGYCLPKETEILAAQEKALIGSEMLAQVKFFNDTFIKYWAEKIMEHSPERVIFTSFSFKSGVEDLRNSPYLAIADILRKDFGMTVSQASARQAYHRGDVIVDVHGDYLPEQNNPAELIRIGF